MGYITTAIAAAAANASNLRPVRDLPDISPFDLLLPRCVDHLAPIQPTGRNVDPITFYTVKRNKYGKKQIVAHRSQPGDKGDDKPSKTDANAELFTAEEDALLKDLKAKHMSNKNIAQELKRTVKQIKRRCHELKITGAEIDKDDENKGAKDGNDTNKGATWREIAREMKCATNQLKVRFNEIDPEAAKKAEEKEDAQTQHHRKRDLRRRKKASSKTSSSDEEASFIMDQWASLPKDEPFSPDELRTLSQIMVRERHQSWAILVSLFFEETGRRVDPNDLYGEFEELAACQGA
nr:hypothetical protein CFP56_77179 [Quercus suber]